MIRVCAPAQRAPAVRSPDSPRSNWNTSDAGKEDFDEVEEITDGIGPRMNLDSCVGCHAQPSSGGTSPAVNPQVAFATMSGGDTVPSFLSPNGPVREARFIWNRDGSPDGGVHALFTITGRPGASRRAR